jgi:hypothetical protein
MSNHEQSEFTIVWQECGPQSSYASRFFVPGFEGHLPFFIQGDDFVRLQGGKQVELSEDQLLKGILYTILEFEENRKPWHTEETRQTLLYLLDILMRGFQFPSPEKMILDVAADVRTRNGNQAASVILESGVRLIPASDKIKSDLVVVLWDVAAEFPPGQVSSGQLDQIVELVMSCNLMNIHENPRQYLCYICLAALFLLGRKADAYRFFDTHVQVHVTYEVFKYAIRDLYEDPDHVRIRSFSGG